LAKASGIPIDSSGKAERFFWPASVRISSICATYEGDRSIKAVAALERISWLADDRSSDLGLGPFPDVCRISIKIQLHFSHWRVSLRDMRDRPISSVGNKIWED
jgi:hypothetical protein